MPDFPKIFGAKSQQRCAVDFRISADVILDSRMERVSVFVVPDSPGISISLAIKLKPGIAVSARNLSSLE
jgi:hypothetical protein